MYAPCDDETLCADGTCLELVINGQVETAYCTGPCQNAALDCDAPPDASATPTCIQDDAGTWLCALDCSLGKSCPYAMSCWSATPHDVCF